MSPVRLCNEPRCGQVATARGKCDQHRKDVERERSARRRAATNGVYKKQRWLMLRRQVIFEQPMCAICDERTTAEIDHITPISAGGAPYERSNVRGLCTPCHIERHRHTAS